MTNPNKTLYVSDLDGTLLGADSRISQRSCRLLTELADEGVMITAATARTPATVDMLLRGSGLRMPVVTMTGAAIWDPLSRKFRSVEFITPDAVGRIRQAFADNSLTPFVYTIGDDGIIHTYHNGPMSKRDRAFADERAHLPLKRIHFDSPAGLQTLPDTVLFFAMGPRQAVQQCAERLRTEGGCSVSAYNDIFNHDTALLEIMAEGVSKASAIRRLAREVGASSVTVFGDNLNDIPMMQAADHAVAVANAMPEVKAIAHEVIGPNTADAVATYIRERESR